MMELPVAVAVATSTSFPIVFFNGKQKVKISTITVHPILGFKT